MKIKNLIFLLFLANSSLEALYIEDRICKSCNEEIPKNRSRYFSCDEHFSCQSCLITHIKNALEENTWPSCISCNKNLDPDFIEEEFPKLYEKLKEKNSCTICFDLVSPEDRTYHCEDHWSCEPCFKSYIDEWINKGKIPIKCFEQNCENLIKLEYLQKNYSKQYKKMIKWIDEHSSKNIKKQNRENKELIIWLMSKYPNVYTQCPKCKFLIERIYGCDHMDCLACGQRFLFFEGRFRSNLPRLFPKKPKGY